MSFFCGKKITKLLFYFTNISKALSTYLMFPISRSLSTSRRRTDELGSRLERPINFECKLNEPMHIGMQLLHPAATDHSVSISRRQVQCIFSFSFGAERLHRSAPDFCWTSEFNELSTLFGRLSCWWYGTTAVVVLPMSSGLHSSGCTTPCLCCRWPSPLCASAR